jgi:hypothetical protein
MRIRTIKPEFWMHEGLCACSEFTRLLAIALLNWSDDEGYFMANPVLIRGQLFPFLDDSKMIPRSLQDLSRVGWIRLGKDNQNRDVGMVVNFSKHQRVDKPKPSEIKACITFQDQSKINPGTIQDESKEERKGMEQGMEPLSTSGRDEALESIWKAFPPSSRARSSKKQLSDEWRKAKPKPDIEELLKSIYAWSTSQDWTKDGGQFVPGAHLFIKNRKWEVEPMQSPQKQRTFTSSQVGI